MEWWGAKWYLLGFFSGPVALLLATTAYLCLHQLLWSGMPHKPRTCRNGTCRFFDDFEIRTLSETDVGHFYKGGDRYDKRG